MAARHAIVLERFAFNSVAARALSRDSFLYSSRPFQSATVFSAYGRYYSSLNVQRSCVAPCSSARRPCEPALGLKSYSSTSNDQDEGRRSGNREKTRVKSSDAPKEQHGSVIMQFVESKGEPKELTTARKGMCVGWFLVCVHHTCSLVIEEMEAELMKYIVVDLANTELWSGVVGPVFITNLWLQ